MNKEQVKGETEKVGGKIKEQWGKTTGNIGTEEKGRHEQAEGQARKNAGNLQEQVEDAAKHRQ